jgi:hypothetical protein
MRHSAANMIVEVHPLWEEIVTMSHAAGLGNKGIKDLDEELFPIEDFPGKYNEHGRFVG